MADKYQAADVQIYKTKNYDMFKDVEGNRVLDGTHLSNLEGSIRERNWLANEPGIVNENFELIDGQHRLAVAEKLDEWFYFTIAGGANDQDVILLNTSSQTWKVENYLDYYVAKGKKDYIELKKFMEKHNITLGNAGALLTLKPSISQVRMHRKAFKAGHFEITDKSLGEEMVKWMYEFKPLCATEKMWQTRAFVRALWIIEINSEVFIEDVYEKVQLEGVKIFREEDFVGYLRQFETILNAGQGNRDRVRLY